MSFQEFLEALVIKLAAEVVVVGGHALTLTMSLKSAPLSRGVWVLTLRPAACQRCPQILAASMPLVSLSTSKVSRVFGSTGNFLRLPLDPAAQAGRIFIRVAA